MFNLGNKLLFGDETFEFFDDLLLNGTKELKKNEKTNRYYINIENSADKENCIYVFSKNNKFFDENGELVDMAIAIKLASYEKSFKIPLGDIAELHMLHELNRDEFLKKATGKKYMYGKYYARENDFVERVNIPKSKTEFINELFKKLKDFYGYMDILGEDASIEKIEEFTKQIKYLVEKEIHG